MKSTLITLLILISSASSIDAQLFKKLANRVQDKIEKKVEDKIVEEVSEEIARRAMKPIDKAFDDMFRQAYKDEYGKDYDDSEYEGDPERRSEMMAAMLGSMYGNVELPDAYNFDYVLNIEVSDHGEKKPNKMIMLISTQEGIFGMEQSEDDKEVIMVFDTKNDKVVVFNKKEKTAMALPNVMKMAGAFAKAEMEEEFNKDFKFEKINKTKKVAGYPSQGYKYKSEEDEGEFYTTTDLPFDWKDTFGDILEQMSPNFYKEHPEYDIKGMMMYSEIKRKEDGKKSKWEVKSIKNDGVTINTSDYELPNMGGK